MNAWVPWVLIVALAGGGGYALYRDNTSRASEAAVRKEAEARLLASMGQVVIERRISGELATQIRIMSDTNAELREALDKARKAAPRSRVVGAVRASTGPLVAATIAAGPVSDLSSGSAAPCLLAPGESAEIKVDQVVLETAASNHLLVGAASVWARERQILAGPFSAPLTMAVVEPVPAAGWPWWIAVATGVGGLLLGGGLVAVAAR